MDKLFVSCINNRWKRLSLPPNQAKKQVLVFIIYLDDNDADALVVGVIVHLGDMPVAREEDEEAVGRTVHELGFLHVVGIMNHVGAVFCVGLAGVVVDKPEALHAFHAILEVYVMEVALRAALFQLSILAVLHTHRE